MCRLRKLEVLGLSREIRTQNIFKSLQETEDSKTESPKSKLRMVVDWRIWRKSKRVSQPFIRSFINPNIICRLHRYKINSRKSPYAL